MFEKIGFRNAKRSFQEYLVYVITMTLVAALMFAFHSLLFSKSIREISEMFGIMEVLLLLATAVVVLLTGWLVQYMVSFQLKRRSREFGIYLLLGMKRKEIFRIFLFENLCICGISFFLGILAGSFLKQVLLTIFYSMMQTPFKISMEGGIQSLLLTGICYGSCFLFAFMLGCGRIKKMSIRQLTINEKENEQPVRKREKFRRLVLARKEIYQGANLFLFRQLTAKIRTMGITSMIRL